VTARLDGGPAPVPRHPTLVAALSTAAGGGDGVVFVDARERERRLPWRQVLARARAAAGALRRRGVGRGDRVAIVLPTGPEFLDAFFGALLAGAAPVPLYPPVRLGRLDEYHRATARLLRIAAPRLLVTDGLISSLLGDVGAPIERLPARALRGPPVEAAEVEPDDLGLVQFSSGTTAEPRGVALTHANLVAQCAAIEAVLPHRPGAPQRCVSWLPLYHDMGLIGCLLSAAWYPGELVLIPPDVFLARPWLWLRAIARHRGTISPAPSFAYALCADRVRDAHLAGHDLSSWRHALDGAEPVSAAAMRRFAARFARFGFDERALTPVYGLAEAALGVSFSPPGRPPRVRPDGAVSVGRPLPGVEVEVDGDVGPIRVRGPAVMAGYLHDAAATARALRGGWLDTGDLGVVVDGELYVVGRAKDVVVVRGANHAPQTFEEAAGRVAGVRAGCVAAVGFTPPDAGGEELLVLAERARGADPREDGARAAAVRAAVLERTGIRPHTVALLDPGTLPRTSSGKLRRAEALRRWRAGALDPPRAPSRLALLWRALVAGWRPARAT
jgi:acyl-CoA synthetase (AMP-forming)/AMP-acid ligase II